MTTHTAQGWLQYFEFVGYNNHEDLDRFAIWLDLTSKRTEDIDLHALAEEEQEHFMGQYKSPADFTEESMTNAYGYEIEALPTSIQYAIDWSQVWDKEMRHDCIDYELIEENEYRWFIWHAH